MASHIRETHPLGAKISADRKSLTLDDGSRWTWDDRFRHWAMTFGPRESVSRPGYSAPAVDKAIASSIRAGHKISKREATAIHRLLKGRHNPSHSPRGAVKVGYVIHAQRGSGPLMHYRGEKFTNNDAPEVFTSAAKATHAAREILANHPIMRKYRVTVEPYRSRRQNPSRRAGSAAVERAATLFKNFSGHDARTVEKVTVKLPSAMLAVGELDFLGYSAIRDGELEKYIHRFKKRARPLLAASHDGRTLQIVGGRFEFTEAGIEDR